VIAGSIRSRTVTRWAIQLKSMPDSPLGLRSDAEPPGKARSSLRVARSSLPRSAVSLSHLIHQLINPLGPSITSSYCHLGIIALVTKPEIGLILANSRRRSGRTQAELAHLMGTTQPVIARAEAGYRMPTLDFIDRWARGTGVPIVLKLGQTRPGMPTAATRRALVRSVLGRGRFNPWDRNPAPVEVALLEQAGLSREYFERMKRRRDKRP